MKVKDLVSVLKTDYVIIDDEKRNESEYVLTSRLLIEYGEREVKEIYPNMDDIGIVIK